MPLPNKSRAHLVLCSALALAPLAQASNYYVATNGNDSSNGSELSPWRTISHAVDKMTPGDTTYVKGGVYSEPPIFRRSGTASAPIRLLNVQGESPVVDCRNHDLNYPRFQNGAGYVNPIGHITIEGFEVRNCRHGMMMYNGHDIVIRGNWIHHSRANGIHGNGKNILIDRNVINRNGTFTNCGLCNKEHGVYGTGPGWVITNNLIYDNLANGIVVAGYPRCVDSGCAEVKRYTDSSYGGADNWLIANNTIAYNNYRGAIVLWKPLTTNSKIINNIFFENSQKYSGDPYGVSFFSNPGGGHIISNNICYGTLPGSTTCIGANGAGKYIGSNNLTSNPGFVGAAATLLGVPNFNLRADSPAINRGLAIAPATKVPHDFLGNGRPQGGAYDIGAYEFMVVGARRPKVPGDIRVR